MDFPPGFAHGYYVISDWAEIVYATSDVYAPRYERTLKWNDPEIGIKWPFNKMRIRFCPKKINLGYGWK